MEEDIYVYASQVKVPKSVVKIEERLKEAMEQAGDRQAYESAHDEELLRALTIVADFIKKKRRVCYGGTAMNAILPKEKQFYTSEHDLPDYDFYTPELAEDVRALVADLKAAGFKDVYHRIGIHEGTEKILVNFVAVADMTRIEPDLFHVLYRRSVEKDGLHYTDPDILRMMMYLELSRPRGQVSRWEKVYERLQLINQEFPVRAGKGESSLPRIPGRIHKMLLEYCIENQRVVCSGPLVSLYARGVRRGKVSFRLDEGGSGPPVIFVSPDPKADATILKRVLRQRDEEADVRLYLHKGRGEIVPERLEVRVGRQTVALIVKEVACHAYNNFPLKDGRMLNVASLEFLVTLYLSLHIFTGGSSTDVLGSNAMGQVREFVRLATENNGAKRSAFPPFTLSCRGHQTGYASLIRKKVERIQREKGEKGEEKSRKTRRRHRSRSRQAASAGRRNRQTTSAGRRDRQTTSAGRRDRQTKKRED